MMKKICLLLIILSSFAFAEIDERKTDVYFANGILTEEEDAKINAKLLDTAIESKLGTTKYNQQIGNVTYAYNHTISNFQDLRESLRQVINVTGFVDMVIDWLPGTLQTVHNSDIELQVDKYEASIKSGHSVLVVAHSQGNLFTQEAYERLGERSSANNQWLQKYFEAISIASPDRITDIKPNMPSRLGWENDMVAIIGGSNNDPSKVHQVKWEFFDGVATNQRVARLTDNYVYASERNTDYKGSWKAVEGFSQKYKESNVHSFKFYMGLPLEEGDETKSNYGHVYINPFTQSKLIDPSLKTEIMSQIGIQLTSLQAKPSQWEKSAEIGCICKDKAIFVKHKYESTLDVLMQELQVLPFDEEGKLYSEGFDYIKGSAEGESVLRVSPISLS